MLTFKFDAELHDDYYIKEGTLVNSTPHPFKEDCTYVEIKEAYHLETEKKITLVPPVTELFMNFTFKELS